MKKILFTGLIIGAMGITLTALGNPANMGFCIACFLRDIAGGLGLHGAGAVQYLRPEIIGLGLGSMFIARAKGEFRVRGGANPLGRFVLGFAMMIGALAFLGCPLRTVLRLGAGDLNALVGLGGLATGIFCGVLALKKGYNPGRAVAQPASSGYVFPGILLALLAALLLRPGFVIFSESGPGAQAAPILAALVAGLVVGILAQRTRLCMTGGVRDMLLVRDPHLLWGFGGILVAALVGNVIMGYFQLGFANQPIAHTAHLWNFLGLTVVGYAGVLAGGCPLRQLILAGTGDTDAVITVFGMVAGAAVAHNFGLAASGQGIALAGQIAVLICLAVLSWMGFGQGLTKSKKEAA